MPGSNALTNLTNVKTYMDIKSSDTDGVLDRLIDQITARIERIVDRKFKARDYRWWLTTNQERLLTVPQWPLIYVNRVAHGALNAMSVDYSGAGIRATIQVFRDDTGETTGVRLVSYSSSGVRTTSELTDADNGSVNAMVTAIDAVSGWDATELVNVPTADLAPTGGMDAKNQTAYFTYPDQDDSDYRVDYDTGQISLSFTNAFDAVWREDRLPITYQGLLVEARAGYETIPDDIELTAIEMVSSIFSSRSVNQNIASESIGDYSYSLSSVPMNEQQLARLETYKAFKVGGVA